MKSSTLMLLGGVYLSVLTIASVLAGTPLLFSGVLCFGGAGLVFAGLFEMIVNYN
jgi:hypothetical protein